MMLETVGTVEIDAPRERVVAVSISSDLENVRRFEDGVESVTTNDVPDGAAGHVATVQLVKWSVPVEMTITVLESELPDRLVERYDASGTTMHSTTRFTELTDERTLVTLEIQLEIRWWDVLARLTAPAMLRSQVRKSLGRLKTHLEPTEGAGTS